MTTPLIESLQNPLCKQIKQIQNPSKYNLPYYIIEHPKFITDTLSRTPSMLDCLLIDETNPRITFPDSKKRLIQQKIKRSTTRLINQLSRLKNSSGIIAVMKRPTWDTFNIRSITHLIILDQVQSPQNVGAIVRSACAFGWDGILYTKGTASPFHPESVNASTGLINRIPILPYTSELRQTLTQQNMEFITLDCHSKNTFLNTNIPKTCTLILGNEGQGVLDPSLKELTTQTLTWEMAPEVESLNVSVAAGIGLYLLKNPITNKTTHS